MKNICTTALAIFSFIFFSNTVFAQQCVWARAAKGSGGFSPNVFARAVAADRLGNVYTAGEYASDSILFGSSGFPNCCANVTNLYISRYNASGNFSWAKVFGNSFDVHCYGAATDASGNVYVVGNFIDTLTFGTTTFISSSRADVFLVKLSSTGSVLWAKQGKGVSGSLNNQAVGVVTDNNQNVIITGYFEDTISFGATSINGRSRVTTFITKFDSAGTLVWAHNADPGLPYGISTDASGNIFLTGATSGDTTFFSSSVYFLGSPANLDAFVVKYNSSGNAIWVKGIWGTGPTDDVYSELVAADASGNVFISGVFYGATVTIGSTTLTSPDSMYGDVYIAKYDASGNFLWAKSNTGSNSTGGSSGGPMALVVDPAGNPILSVFCDTPIRFGSLSYASNTSAIVKFSSTGTPLWFWGPSSTTAAFLMSLSMDGAGRLYAGGPYGSTIATFDTVTLTNAHTPYSNGYVAKFINVSSGIEEINATKTDALLYPNPAGDRLNICSTTTISYVVIVDLLGQTLRSVMPNGNAVEIDIHDLPTGIYFVRINGVEVKKFEKL